MTGITRSQTVGPYFKYGLTPNSEYAWNGAFGNDLVTPDVPGESIRIQGRTFDGDGQIVADSMLENLAGGRPGSFRRSRCSLASKHGVSRLRPLRDRQSRSLLVHHDQARLRPRTRPEAQAPHIVLAVYARGMTRRAQARIYFSEEASNASDPILAFVPPDRRETLIAKRVMGGNGAVYRFDMHLQCDNETVFFDI